MSQHDLDELRLAARTIRSQTLSERRATRDLLVAHIREQVVSEGPIAAWTVALEHADVSDVDVLQELLYGLDALARVELGLPAPESRALAF